MNKDGSINQANVEHNKKCEKDMLKDNPWLNEPGGKEYAEAVLGKDHDLLKVIKKKKKKSPKKQKKQKKQKQTKKEKKQKGGALCLPCISPVLTGLGLFGAGAGAVAAVNANKAGSSFIQKYKSSSSSDGKNIQRKENFELVERVKQGKKSVDRKRKFIISQKNNKVIIQKGNKKTTDTFQTIQKASDFYNKKIKECKKEGFKKCSKTTKRTKKFSKKSK